MPPRGKQFTPAEKLLESQNRSVRGACGFVLTGDWYFEHNFLPISPLPTIRSQPVIPMVNVQIES